MPGRRSTKEERPAIPKQGDTGVTMRLSTRTLIRLCRTLGIVLLAVGLMLVVSATSARAQERKNCPDGFHWERMSGQCCVQDYETLPEHGKIGYTGNSLCEDGYVATYERRGTKDGKGVDGCPGYTSFVFLKSCSSQAGGAADLSFAGDADLSDLTAAVYGGGSGPSAQDLATIGGLVTGILVLTGGTVVVLRRRPVRLQDLQLRMPTADDAARAWREWRAAEEQFQPLRQRRESLERRREELIQDWIYLRDAISALEGQTGLTGRYTITQILGFLAGLAGGLLTGGWVWVARIVGGGVSVGAGLLKGEQQGLKADLTRAFAITDSKINDVDREMEAFKRVYQIGEDRVKATKGRYESLRQSSGY